MRGFEYGNVVLHKNWANVTDEVYGRNLPPGFHLRPESKPYLPYRFHNLTGPASTVIIHDKDIRDDELDGRRVKLYNTIVTFTADDETMVLSADPRPNLGKVVSVSYDARSSFLPQLDGLMSDLGLARVGSWYKDRENWMYAALGKEMGVWGMSAFHNFEPDFIQLFAQANNQQRTAFLSQTILGQQNPGAIAEIVRHTAKHGLRDLPKKLLELGISTPETAETDAVKLLGPRSDLEKLLAA